MDILTLAIKTEGTVGKLAKALGVNQSVVSNWKRRGLSHSWTVALSAKYAKQLRQALKQPA